MSSPQVHRASILQQQGRHELAERELRQHLAENPQDGLGHALLAISLIELDRRDEAENAAREAIGAAPDSAFSHYALSRVLSERNRLDEAAMAIEEAIRLEPEDADYHTARAGIELGRQKWKDALEAAETALQFDPQHVGANNLRAMALVKLGRKAEAGATISSTLAREPENALSHANQGWTCLERGRRDEAIKHFRESLRLDPTSDWAQAGLVEAIKAGNPVYAAMQKYFLWMQKLSPGARWGILIGGYFIFRFLGSLRVESGAANLVISLLILAYLGFALLAWLAAPVFNLMLFLHPYGSHALSRDQRFQALLVGGCILFGLSFFVMSFFAEPSSAFMTGALVFGLLSLPISAIHICDRGWPRVAMGTLSLGLAALGVSALAARLSGTESGMMSLFLPGVFLSQWIANWLMSQTPAR